MKKLIVLLVISASTFAMTSCSKENVKPKAEKNDLGTYQEKNDLGTYQ